MEFFFIYDINVCNFLTTYRYIFLVKKYILESKQKLEPYPVFGLREIGKRGLEVCTADCIGVEKRLEETDVTYYVREK